jgi:serine O-acetyltransferase
MKNQLKRVSALIHLDSAETGDFENMRVLLDGFLLSAKKTLFPELCSHNTDQTYYELRKAVGMLIKAAMPVVTRREAFEAAASLTAALPEIRRLLMTDITAAYEGDPAASSRMEVILCYPAIEALTAYRIAHLLYCVKLPVLPRFITELAHRSTGIDIHPGAKIGEYFFIDHGTGVVIGETAVIGKRVKLYQGVTIGAKSFPPDADGNPIKGIKRHPDIGDNVIIYAGATVLGGKTVIGNGCIIGGNAWVTRSVPDNTNIPSNYVG